MKNERKRCPENRLRLWLILAAAIFVSLPLGTDFLNAGQDTAASLSRIRSVAEGMFSAFPLRLGPLPQTAYGYSASVFSADVFYLIPAVLYRVGLKLQTAYKLTVILFNLMTAFIAGHSFRMISQDADAGAAAGFLYVVCPCRVYSIYGAGHLGEVYAWTFLPLVIWGLIRLFVQRRYERTEGLLILGYSLVLLAWPVTFTCAAVSFAVLFLLTIPGNFTKEFWNVLIRFALGFAGINAWYLIPMTFRLRDASAVAPLLTEHIREYGLYLIQYAKIFEFGGDRLNVWERGLTSAAAVSPGIIVIAAVIYYLVHSRVSGEKDSGLDKILTAALIMILLSLNLFPWDLFENRNLLCSIILGLVQTPAKFAVMADALLIAGASVVLSKVPSKSFGISLSGIVCLIGFLTAQFQIGRLLTTRGFIRDEQIMEWSRIGFQVVAQESTVWRISEAVTFMAVVGMIVLWRYSARHREAENG